MRNFISKNRSPDINEYKNEDNIILDIFNKIKNKLWRMKNKILNIKEESINYTIDNVKGLYIDGAGLCRINLENEMLTNYLKKDLSEKIKTGIAETKDCLIKLKEITSDKRLIILLIPFREQVYAHNINEIVIDYLDNVDILQPNKIISDFCDRNYIQYFDSTPYLIDNNKKELYFSIDPHFNSNGSSHLFHYVNSVILQNDINKK